MRWIAKTSFYLRSLFSRRKLEAQMTEEMRLHLEMETEAKIAAGMSPAEARYAALREFGNVACVQERTREEQGWVWLEQCVKDVGFTIRSLARTRGFSLTVMAVLIVGITVSSVVWSYTEKILFQPLPYPQSDRLVVFGSQEKGGEIQQGCYGIQFRAYEEQTRIFSEFAATEWTTGNVVISGQPRVTNVENISPDFFHTLGVKPVLGRGFAQDDFANGGTDTVVISTDYWREQLQSDPAVIGRQILINRLQCMIVGVMATNNFTNASIYRPLILKVDPMQPFRTWLMVVGRLKPGISVQEASAALSTVKIAGLPGWAFALFKVREPALIGMASTFDRTSYWLLLVGGVLLYGSACLNGMNLMLARLIGRQRELSIRLTLGSTRWRSARLLLFEAMILALVAGIAAGLLWCWAYPALTSFFSGDHGFGLADGGKWWSPILRVWFGHAGALSIFAGIAISAIPVWRVIGVGGNAPLNASNGASGETRKIGRVRDGLVILQSTFAVILLVGTGLMVRSFERIHRLDIGFNPVGRVNVNFSFPADFQPAPEAKLALFERLCARLEKLPGVKGAAYGVGVLMTAEWHGEKVKLPDGTERDVSGQSVSANFAEVAGLTMVKGRWFSDQRIRNEAVSEAVINERMARELYGDRNPLGEFTPDRHYVVVGVVRDLRGELRTPAGLHFYFPAWVHPGYLANITLRLESEPAPEFSGLVQRAVYAMEPRLIVPEVTSVNEAIVMSTWSERLAYSMLKALTPLACGLALAGLFSVLAYNVECRRKEFGVRLALGASPMNLHRLVLKRGLATAAAGVFVGSICSLGLTRFIQSLLFETAPYDPLIYLVVASGLLIAAAVACWLPARRAAKVDPLISLRAE